MEDNDDDDNLTWKTVFRITKQQLKWVEWVLEQIGKSRARKTKQHVEGS